MVITMPGRMMKAFGSCFIGGILFFMPAPKNL
jgi:hypothetical protein